jgi:hypothetical protein
MHPPGTNIQAAVTTFCPHIRIPDTSTNTTQVFGDSKSHVLSDVVEPSLPACIPQYASEKQPARVRRFCNDSVTIISPACQSRTPSFARNGKPACSSRSTRHSFVQPAAGSIHDRLV